MGQQSLRARYRGLFATDTHSIVEVKRSQGQQCGQSLARRGAFPVNVEPANVEVELPANTTGFALIGENQL